MNPALAAARAACLFLCAAAAVAQTPSVLTQADAMARVLDTHPDLRIFRARGDALVAARRDAELRPAPTLEIGLENALGTGEHRGLSGAELSLGLAAVLERGGKLDARRTLAQSRIDALAVEREARRLDLLAETARRYLDAAAARRRLAIATDEVAQRGHAVDAARRRQRAGAAPESSTLSAQAARARAELDRAQAEQAVASADRHLAALWGERAPRFELPAVDPTQLPQIEPVETLAALLDQTPELLAFADQRRIAEARAQLARSEARADVQWQLGLRRLQGSGDTALIGALSLPLGRAARAQPAIDIARAELAQLEVEREARDLALYATLIEAHGRYRAARLRVDQLGREVLPLLEQARDASERAFRAGAAGYLDWSQAQAERTAALGQRLEAAVEAQRTLIELQRLTGRPFLASDTQTGAQP